VFPPELLTTLLEFPNELLLLLLLKLKDIVTVNQHQHTNVGEK
jgi:hypothetical protein